MFAAVYMFTAFGCGDSLSSRGPSSKRQRLDKNPCKQVFSARMSEILRQIYPKIGWHKEDGGIRKLVRRRLFPSCPETQCFTFPLSRVEVHEVSCSSRFAILQICCGCSPQNVRRPSFVVALHVLPIRPLPRRLPLVPVSLLLLMLLPLLLFLFHCYYSFFTATIPVLIPRLLLLLQLLH